MVMRSPACFIFRIVLMVTFFKVHLLVLVPRRCLSAWSPTRKRLSAGQPASRQNPTRGTITSPGAGDHSSEAGAERLVVMRAVRDAREHPDQVFEIGLALDEVDVAGVDDQERSLLIAMEEIAVSAGKLGAVIRVELPLELAAALPDAREQHFDARL